MMGVCTIAAGTIAAGFAGQSLLCLAAGRQQAELMMHWSQCQWLKPNAYVQQVVSKAEQVEACSSV